MIRGLVTTRTVLLKAPLILRLYGPRILARCVWAILTCESITFLAIVFGA
jgi:hypothetical protein